MYYFTVACLSLTVTSTLVYDLRARVEHTWMEPYSVTLGLDVLAYYAEK